MTARTLLRRGVGSTPPQEMQPGELAFGDNGRIWIGDFYGDAQEAGNPDGFQTAAQVTARIAANAPGFQNASQVNTLISAALAALTLDGGTF